MPIRLNKILNGLSDKEGQVFVDDISVSYLGVFVAAVVYFIIGIIWYKPSLFGNQWEKHDEELEERSHYLRKIGAYLGEFIISLIIAYVLATFIQISSAERIIEGMAIALWIWVGFIATTHFSAVLWGRKIIKHFFIHAAFMLVGIIAMGAVIMIFDLLLSNYFR